MSKDIKLDNAHIMFGDALQRLKELPDNSLDSIVTDPPYGLSDNKYVADTIIKWVSGERGFIPDGKGFMGKAWDSFVPPPAIWDECLRVLKPGGHLLAFFGSRTQDIGALSIRLAGFEIRDSIAWVYGSGFPKSLDISKAIDKVNGQYVDINGFGDYLKSKREENKLSQKDIAKNFPSKTGGLTGCVWNWENGANVPTVEQYKVLKSILDLSDKYDDLIARIEAEREVIGTTKTNTTVYQNIGGDNISGDINITTPATDAAKQWAGWGTALKPAVEPIVVARKPLSESTVANNVLKWGTGGLNIDASRVGTETRTYDLTMTSGNFETTNGSKNEKSGTCTVTGRFPANIILDETTAEMLDEQSGISKTGDIKPHQAKGTTQAFGMADVFISTTFKGDSGGASRFFYVAKASKKDRNEGMSETLNTHPTVKPTTLMEYLIKLVTPIGGTVLDPFTGSGSTGKAALLNGFKFIGCELTEDYLPIIEGRLKFAANKYADEQAKNAQEAAETLFQEEE